VRLLDFGCGPGTFTAQLLDEATFELDALRLALVEPVDSYRREALERLRGFSNHPVEAWPALPPGTAGRFDLALSNHVFYYVPDLDATLGAILASLARPGLFVASMAGWDNALIQVWVRAFAMLGKPVPYHTAEEFEAALVRLGATFAKRPVSYELAFADDEENRTRVLRFLLGDHLAALPRRDVLDFFNPHAENGRVVVRTGHVQFAVRRE
jgi:trans-aconitate 2-methyltransferase